MMKGCRVLELRVINIGMMKGGVLFNYSRKRSGIENEENNCTD